MSVVVVFDLDGTLVDSAADIHEALSVALSEVEDGRQSRRDDEEALAEGFLGLPLEVFFHRARPRAGPAGTQAFVAAYRRHYHQHLLRRTRPFPGVVEGLARLRALPDPPRLCVATTKYTATARRVLDGLSLSPFFADGVIQGSDGLPCKPDPAVIHAVMQRLGHGGTAGDAPPGLMVGDTEHDIYAGRAAGLRTCAVGWSAAPAAQLSAARPDHHASTFAEVVEVVIRMRTPHH
jgi:phosphoglycolate phosphatase